MWIFYTSLSLFVLFTAYFFILPLSKKRPVLVKQSGLVAYGTVLAVALLYPLLEILPLFIVIVVVVIIVVIIIFLLFFRMWFVYGITETMISDALLKAASATRAPIEKTDGSYIIDNSLRVRPYNIVKRIHIVSFKKGGESKKAKITEVVFNKFIQNYFL